MRLHAVSIPVQALARTVRRLVCMRCKPAWCRPRAPSWRTRILTSMMRSE
ncbi:hypothetical protein D8I24_5081 [Cupriavidus necator H850]|nr:hypothetical protein D8I24_5081 [Cupriavidus necator H850]